MRSSHGTPNGRHAKRAGRARRARRSRDGGTGATPEPDALKVLMLQLRELREFALHYISARADRTRLKVREQGMRFALAAIGLVALSGLIVAAVCCLVNGMAGGLAVMFGDRAWAGNLTAGVVLLGVMALGIWFVWNKQLKGSRESAVTKYEARRTRQRAEFGHAVGDSSASGDVPL